MSDTTEKLYAERDSDDLCEYYFRHVMAMTAEGLHAKNKIAAELAWRDREIDRLRAALPHPTPAAEPVDVASLLPAPATEGPDVLRDGGEWLATVRRWIQSNKINGEQVTWGSGDVLRGPVTVREFEEVAAYAVATDRRHRFQTARADAAEKEVERLRHDARRGG